MTKFVADYRIVTLLLFNIILELHLILNKEIQ